MSCCGAVLVDGGGCLEMLLALSPRALPDSPIYASGQLLCGHL